MDDKLSFLMILWPVSAKLMAQNECRLNGETSEMLLVQSVTTFASYDGSLMIYSYVDGWPS